MLRSLAASPLPSTSMDASLEIVSYIIPTLIAIFTVPVIWRFAKSIRSAKPVKDDEIYQDEDGKATEESMKEYSTKRSFIVIFVGTGLGLASSFALSVVATIESMNIKYVTIVWLLFWSWVLVLLQVLDVFRETRFVTRFHRGVRSSVSLFLTGILATIMILSQQPDFPQNIAFYVTLGLQIFGTLTAGTTFLFIKRRPDVFAENGKVVERQLQTSIWTKYTYNWSSDILDLAATKLIEPEDLPAMDAHVRAKDVKKSFREIILKPTTSLWLQIFWAYRGALVYQWFMVILSSVVDAAPQLAMLQLLRYLEVREGFGFIDPRAWLCVGSLLLATALETLVDYRITWQMWSELGVPIRSTLTTLIFEKMMKLKDCKEPPSAEKDEKDEKDKNPNGANGNPHGHGHGHGKPDPSKKDAAKKGKKTQSQQDIINMFAVDTNQVGVFGAVNQFYIMFASKFAVSIVFLWLLVGWESLLAGMFVIILFFPVNKYLAGRYGTVQKELMKARDKKTKVISEALQGIRQIKFSANEAEWTEKINDVRAEELILLWQSKLNNLNMMLGSDIAPVFLTVLALATYSYIHGDLLPSVAFTALGVFMQLEGILGMVPFLMMMGINAKVSCDRIDKFLQSDEKPENTYPGDSIKFDNVSVSFPSMSNDQEPDPEEDEEARQARENKFVLRDLTLQFPNNALSVILGPTGAGKSLLLAAILGEVDVLSGNITVPRAPPVSERFDSKATAADWIIPSAIAFVAQTPWIENASIKDNILFGLPHDETRYEKVLKACALADDLKLFDDGDLTEVGAQGISLSGGQKWRLTLARALYSRSGILILDDVFSALDAHVGKYLYDNALMGELADGRTRVLVTHHASLCLPRAKYAVCLSAKGVLEHAGLVKDLRETSAFKNIVQAEDEEASPKEQEANADEVKADGDTNGTTPKADRKPPKKLIEDEARETGSVKRSVYMTYLKATGGYPFWGFVLIFYIIAQALNLSRSYWIKIWTSSYEHKNEMLHGVVSYALQTQFGGVNASSTLSDTAQYSQSDSGFSEMFSTPLVSKLFSSFQSSDASIGYPVSPAISTSFSPSSHAQSSQMSVTALPIEVNNRSLTFYLVGYVVISMVSTVIDIGRFYVVYRGSLRASRKVFQDMTYRVLRTPLRWLDTVPTGRILNRFTADFASMDSQLSSNFAQVAASMLSIVGIMVSALLVSPYIIIFALLLLFFCGRIALRYIRGARSIKRLESIQKSPMISHFTASLQGLSTIRAFGSSQVFETRMHNLIDAFTTATWHNWLFNNWVGFRMSMVGSLFSTVVAAFIVATKGIDASLGGFALAFALSYRRTVNMTLRLLAATELDMNAAERVFEYSGLAIEPEGGADVRASWPEKGELEITDLEIGYAEGLPAILKGLNVHVEMNQRVGIVGRTGAGKSTLSLALFRFLEARRGSIVIDGIDISKIKLHDLRTRLAIIPQDPVLFSGTIRSNLDPFDQFSDFQVREALQRVHLIPSTDNTPVPEHDLSTESSATAVGSSATSVTAAEPANKENTNIFLSLTSPISSSGANLSQGQKQLLCLARAILSRPKLLLLDEATSAVDKKTDTLIQRSIREEFANTTLLVIAHRLSTVMDFDRILVMKDGVAAEYGTPKELLEKEDGVFKDMVAQSGEKTELESMVGSS
ncbi:P-loop containing nucleoside triphosphate hydrolase protein [Mollisia scopiformis]|uniref:p-loop containing nucleoside triphosphate hydrolase protein n=1 Tax=Mollisia scopiformis TaxID=149040 RepID=A0A132B8J8_MOLSC|nr:P-loop containing nucleoside triphosphate hydrolase protein [Mollisia scopiformis]KUJ08725.1 P-loop containing nucleoside triphosphate hydrolase protein [Mollisia scopiformis]